MIRQFQLILILYWWYQLQKILIIKCRLPIFLYISQKSRISYYSYTRTIPLIIILILLHNFFLLFHFSFSFLFPQYITLQYKYTNISTITLLNPVKNIISIIHQFLLIPQNLIQTVFLLIPKFPQIAIILNKILNLITIFLILIITTIIR